MTKGPWPPDEDDLPSDYYDKLIAEHDEAEARVPRLRVVHGADGANWRDPLIMMWVGRGQDRHQVVAPQLANAVTILGSHPEWAGKIAYDQFADRVVVLGAPPWDLLDAPKETTIGEWTDGDTSRACAWLQRREGIDIPPGIVESAINLVAERNAYHPVRDYLRALKWDGEQRLPDVLATHFSCASTEYSKEVGKRWFISAVARVMQPGAQVDCTLVLESTAQGWFKTSALRALVPVRGWYCDTGVELGNKDSLQTLHGVWIYGLDELDSLSRSELTRTKTYLTQTVDRYRPPFGHRQRDFPRQNVFAGTTNATDYFSDRTGNRRFWPGKLLRPIDVAKIVADRDQLWAEALVRYEAKEPWYVDTPQLRKLCEEEQEERVSEDGWMQIVAHWLAHAPSALLPDPADGAMRAMSVDPRKGVTTAEALAGALRIKPGDITRAHTMRVADVLRTIGYTDVYQVLEDGVRVRRYRQPSTQTEEVVQVVM